MLIKNFMVILDIHTCRPIRITKKKKIKLIFNSLFRQEGNIIFPHIANVWIMQSVVFFILIVMFTKTPNMKQFALNCSSCPVLEFW